MTPITETLPPYTIAVHLPRADGGFDKCAVSPKRLGTVLEVRMAEIGGGHGIRVMRSLEREALKRWPQARMVKYRRLRPDGSWRFVRAPMPGSWGAFWRKAWRWYRDAAAKHLRAYFGARL